MESLDVFDDISAEHEAFIDRVLGDYHHVMLGGSANLQKLFVPLYDANGQLEGGLVGRTGWQWLFIAMLFVPEHRRGQGVAGQLLTAAEEEARKRGCKAVYLDTINPAARRVYQRHGYAVVGSLDEFVEGYSVTRMHKDLP